MKKISLSFNALQSGQVSTQPNEIYFNAQARKVYDAVATYNLMRHNQIYTELAKQLIALGGRQIKFLDIGCSTAERMTKELSRFYLRLYHGVDISNKSIDSAKVNARKILRCSKLYTRGDFRAKENTISNNNYDVIWSSYCLHHEKDYKSKLDFLNICKKKLNNQPGACILLTDLIAKENETIEKARERFIDDGMYEWKKIFANDEQLVNEVKKHIFTSDYPTKLSEFQSIANSIGLDMEVLAGPSEDKYFKEHFVMLKFTRKNNTCA